MTEVELTPEQAQRAAYQGLNSVQKRATVLAAGSAGELDAMWDAWEERGQSRQGILYMLVLRQKAALGVELTEEQLALVASTQSAADRGAAEPPIGGSINA